ncbi:hypothetical protein KC644_00335 [Candidatus Berkelbacteria bacterium]|nr:hypothetical protein [Candidatus Berkelbacteria bacterium]
MLGGVAMYLLATPLKSGIPATKKISAANIDQLDELIKEGHRKIEVSCPNWATRRYLFVTTKGERVKEEPDKYICLRFGEEEVEIFFN